MAPVSRKEALVSSPARGPGPRTGAWSKDTLATAGPGKGSFIFAWGHRCGQLAKELTTNQMVWAPGRDKVERRGTRAFPLHSPAPGPSHHCRLPTPTHCKAVAHGARHS